MTTPDDRVLKIARELAKAYPITLSTGRELVQTAMEFNALDVIERVREIHRPEPYANEPTISYCLACQSCGSHGTYPCSTIQALDEKGTSK